MIGLFGKEFRTLEAALDYATTKLACYEVLERAAINMLESRTCEGWRMIGLLKSTRKLREALEAVKQ